MFPDNIFVAQLISALLNFASRPLLNSPVKVKYGQGQVLHIIISFECTVPMYLLCFAINRVAEDMLLSNFCYACILSLMCCIVLLQVFLVCGHWWKQSLLK